MHCGTLFIKCTGRKFTAWCVQEGETVELDMPVVQEQNIEQPVIVEQPMMQEDVAQHGWPGGPLDTSLLTRYADHVARYIWFDTERIEGAKPELRIASLGSKLTGWVPGPGEHHPNIQGWFDESGLKWLERTSLSKVDPQILSAFTERGIFYTPVPVSMEEAAALATELLGVPYEEAYLETSRQRGGTFTQQWIYDCWQRNLHMYHIYDCAARAYLLLLVGCTILTDKSYTRVNAKWLPMFRDLSTLNRFSWVSAALVCLYDNLNDASMFTTHALAGYPTLLQCWIHEYFPTLGRRGESVHRFDEMGYPRAMRGYLRGCTVVPYLPERCLRQFGFVQYIQPPPPHPTLSYTDIDSLWSGYHTSVDRILQLTRPVRFDAETTADYLPWYYTVSHPILCRPHDGPHGAPLVPQFVPAYAPPEADPVPQDAPPAHAPPSGE
ncbi:hypothetical protein TSUD_355620 [Trifolium subterraneum]|uniref:Aminotransferase-like plant mobile domain-containing protein n=1 Tax=Trifolium subterraneum TaxID=3900 RepID=A0A2Z6M3J6_TRISU|nr:hypothetical protein TSUD_355620 [Trifolium subterraneum]